MVDEYGDIVCENCGSTEVICDIFDDEEIHWCQHCGRQVTVTYEDSKDASE